MRMFLLHQNRLIACIVALVALTCLVQLLPLIVHIHQPKHHVFVSFSDVIFEVNRPPAPYKISQEKNAIEGDPDPDTSSSLSLFSNWLFPPDKISDQEFEAIFQQRRRRAYQGCVDRNRTNFRDYLKLQHAPYDFLAYKFLFVDEKNKILFCNVPKVASTNWKKVLLMSSQSPESKYASPADIPDDDINVDALSFVNWTNFKPLVLYPQANATYRIKNYTKIIWVRDPFKRLVSAWRSKFFGPNPYYNRVGRFIIAKFRKNATDEAKSTGWPISFEEFLSYIRLRGGDNKFDVHWNIMSDFCLFCDIQYDYIGRYENLLPEANYLLKKLLPNVPSFPTKNAKQAASKMTKTNYTDLIASLPRQLFEETLSIFKPDFDIFGYKWPNF